MGSLVLARFKPTCEYLGWPLAGREMKLSEEGEIFVRGACLFQGYWKEGKIEPAAEWFGTKDLGIFCPRKGYAIVGRKDWQFISGGENIQPEEIERTMLKASGVEEACVVPVSDPEFGKRPIGFYSGSAQEETLKRHLAEHLPKYKIPIRLICLEEFPRKGLKIDRGAVLSQFVKQII